MSGDLARLVYSLIEAYHNGGTGSVGGNRYHERHGMVTSYDPERYLAKVMYQPEGQESGWLPIESGHIGESYGIAVGLEPGDGKSTGDQVIVRYQEGDLESGKIVQRVHSDNEKPPTVQSGELVIWTKFKKSQGKSGLSDDSTEAGSSAESDEPEGGQGGSGQQIYLNKDGSLTLTDGNGATEVFDGNGNITLTCKNFTLNASETIIETAGKNIQVDATGTITEIAGGDFGIKGGGNVEVKAAKILGVDGGANVTVQGGGSVTDGSVTPPKDNPPLPKFLVLP